MTLVPSAMHDLMISKWKTIASLNKQMKRVGHIEQTSELIERDSLSHER